MAGRACLYSLGLPSKVRFEVMNSTRMPSGSIMYTARPPVLGPMVGVTGGLTRSDALGHELRVQARRSRP